MELISVGMQIVQGKENPNRKPILHLDTNVGQINQSLKKLRFWECVKRKIQKSVYCTSDASSLSLQSDIVIGC